MSILKKAFGISAAVAVCMGLSACSANNGDNDYPDVVGDDWRVTGIVRDGGTITRSGKDTKVLVCVHAAEATFYYDTEEQVLFDSVDYPITLEGDPWEMFQSIDFADLNGDGNSDVTMKFDNSGSELTVEWLWDAQELKFVCQSEESTLPSEAESTKTDIIYAVFHADNVKEYPIEYTGAKKGAEELAQELSKLTGLDFNITASKTDDGWIVDWAANSTLISGLDDREQKEEFFFFDCDSLNWFMMDSLWRTLTENLNTENIYYTMDGGKDLTFEELYPVNEFPSDIPYMGSEFYIAHSDVRGDEENPYACTKGLWRLDGTADTASIEMDGLGGFTMYYASGSVEAAGYLECGDELNNGCLRYDMYTAEGELIVGFYFDSDTQFHLVNEAGSVYLLDTQAAYQGFWEYPDGTILEINGEEWSVYEEDGVTLLAEGQIQYVEDAAYLINDDGSSGGGRVFFDENNNLVDTGKVLTYRGGFNDVPRG
ncbi:MAG: hypothetical protein ACI4KR_09805 [Ruminiclostridium sp.]